MKKLPSNGETIVEVLISIAVVASVLAGSYYVLNKSYRQSQDAVERIAAIKAAESKVEILRTVSEPSTGSSYHTGTAFCVSSSGQLVDNTAANDSACLVNNKYRVTGKRNTTTKTYEIKATWVGLIEAEESATIYFRP